jgi:aldehyde:ferredoxin oxidoreductase
MSETFSGKILRVNLTDRTIEIDRPPDSFFRKYLGGAIGATYLFEKTERGIDALSPANIIAFVPGMLAHVPLGAFSRMMIVSKSPLSSGILDSQAGGYWAHECKTAGFEAVVVEGSADEPVYLLIQQGKAEIRSAKGCWGMETGPAQEWLHSDAGNSHLRTCIIGPGGENKVRFACVTNNLRHFAGRGGLGAVMGSKNLKAITIAGNGRMSVPLKDGERVVQLLKQVNQVYGADDFAKSILTPYGTHWALWFNQEHGRLPTHNFEAGVFAGSTKIDHHALETHPMHLPSEGCLGCRVRCKRVIGYEKGNIHIDKQYGGAEYESLGNLASLLEIDDLLYVEKANELCSRYTLDTVSTGATIAWAVDCFQRGIITRGDTGGMQLRWGDGGMLLTLIGMIARREGFGDLLAEGSKRASAHFGAQAEALTAQCKGVEWPAVDPRVDAIQSLAYSVNPGGADHMTTGGTDCGPEFWELESPPQEEGLTPALVRAYYLQRMLGSAIDGMGLCRFLIGSTGFQNVFEILHASIGWSMSTWEMMRAGERRLTLYRSFNAREGFSIADDHLPARAGLALVGGPSAGATVDPHKLQEAVRQYYALCGWREDGWPVESKMLELDLKWMQEKEMPRPF